MSTRQHPDNGTRKPVELVVEHGQTATETDRAGIEVVSLALDEVDQGSDPYNQTGRFVSLALRDKTFD